MPGDVCVFVCVTFDMRKHNEDSIFRLKFRSPKPQISWVSARSIVNALKDCKETRCAQKRFKTRACLFGMEFKKKFT